MILGCFNYKFYFFCIKIQFQKIVNLLDTTSDNKDLPKLVTKKWVEVYDQSQGNYYVNKEIRIKTLMLIYVILVMHILLLKEMLLLLKNHLLLIILKHQIIQQLMQSY